MVGYRIKDYSIGDVARMTGATQKQLRSWEGKYIPEPERLECGARAYRRYSQKDLDLIREIKRLLDEGFTLSVAAQKAREAIKTNFRKENR